MIKLIVFMAFVIILAVFSIQNMQSVVLNVIFKSPVTVPLVFLLMGTFFAGAVTVLVISSVQKWVKEKQLKEEKKKIIDERKKIFKERKQIFS